MTPKKKVAEAQGGFTDLWPEWFSLGWGIKGWVIDFETAEEWRVKNDYPEEYCLDKIYVIRSQWTKKHERVGRDPYMVFQRACRENWGSKQDKPGPSRSQTEEEQRRKHLEDYERRWGDLP